MVCILDSEFRHHTSESSMLVLGRFSLAQIDPVESKCREMNILLHTQDRHSINELLNYSITREKLVHSIDLFSRHFQRNLPILHSASFSLIQTPNSLLLAMYCIGACYDTAIMKVEHTLKAAMKVLNDIEKQPVSSTGVRNPASANSGLKPARGKHGRASYNCASGLSPSLLGAGDLPGRVCLTICFRVFCKNHIGTVASFI